MGGKELGTPVSREPLLGYHPCTIGILTSVRNPDIGPCQMGSLTGAVASKNVSEAPKVTLRMVGNHLLECKGKRVIDCERDISSRDESRA